MAILFDLISTIQQIPFSSIGKRAGRAAGREGRTLRHRRRTGPAPALQRALRVAAAWVARASGVCRSCLPSSPRRSGISRPPAPCWTAWPTTRRCAGCAAGSARARSPASPPSRAPSPSSPPAICPSRFTRRWSSEHLGRQAGGPCQPRRHGDRRAREAGRQGGSRAQAGPAQAQAGPAQKGRRSRRRPIRRAWSCKAGARWRRTWPSCRGRATAGAKRDSKGRQSCWVGYKLHLDVADGDIPLSAILTSASLHDSQAAIPLAQMTARRVTSLYDMMDSAYDAAAIHGFSRRLGHVPVIAPQARGKPGAAAAGSGQARAVCRAHGGRAGQLGPEGEPRGRRRCGCAGRSRCWAT